MNRVEVNERYKGYEYLVYASSMGHRCGYVRIPSKHYLYKKSYRTPLKKLSNSVLDNEMVGKRSSIDILIFAGLNKKYPDMAILFDVHGGITWSDWGKNHEFKKAGWWIGFDCAHCDDGKDIDLMDKRNREMKENHPMDNWAIVRTKEYVEQECKNLIDQIIKYFN